jgi:uncharacterized membrane protein YsdA (DUF1294 family)
VDLAPACIALVGWLVLACIGGFSAMALDKSRARRGRRRIPERTLHLVSLAGGWPGVALAMLVVRHKTRKPRFIAWFLAAAALATAGAWLVASRLGCLP